MVMIWRRSALAIASISVIDVDKEKASAFFCPTEASDAELNDLDNNINLPHAVNYTIVINLSLCSLLIFWIDSDTKSCFNNISVRARAG
jgi:hypothetical protein